MGIGTKLNRTLRAFIERQPVFFVATAAPDGRVNVSPKGMSTLRILGDAHIRWLNLSGSGNETAAHLRASNRMTLMFCAFEGNPMILRVYGQATTTHPRDADWEEKVADFPTLAGSRQIFDLRLDLVQTSCGSCPGQRGHGSCRQSDERQPARGLGRKASQHRRVARPSHLWAHPPSDRGDP